MNWFHGFYRWCSSSIALRRLTVAGRMAYDWSKSSNQLNRQLRQSIRRLETIQQQWTVANDEAIELMREHEASQRQYETVVDGLRNEAKVLQEVLIPTMTAADKLLLQRYDTELSLLVKRQVISMGKEEGM